MSKFRLAGFSGALVVAAIVGGTLISAVAAAPMSPPASGGGAPAAAPSAAAGGATAEYCATYRAAFAADLGVTEDALKAAARKALATTIAKAVADGDLTKVAGDRLQARLDASTTDGCKVLAGAQGRIAKAARGALGVIRDGLEAGAKALGMTPAEVRAALKDGTSLKDLAGTKKVDYAVVSEAVVGAVKADLDKAVAAGTIRQPRADRVLDRLTNALADGRLRPAATPAG